LGTEIRFITSEIRDAKIDNCQKNNISDKVMNKDTFGVTNNENKMDALKFFKKLFDEGLVNDDFAVAVAGPKGLRSLPTSGYSGMLAIPKTSVKTEEELKQVLTFLDKLNDKEAQIIATNGVEGRHFELKDEELVELDKDNKKLVYEKQDLNQFQMFIPENRFHEPKQTPLRKKEQELMKANEDIVVPNPAEALISEVYSQKGQQLDNIINDARIKFIVGQIDESGFQEAVDLWYKSGGVDYVNEINELYQEVQN
jgi:putative aldouronate transport system substrate-binding protein